MEIHKTIYKYRQSSQAAGSGKGNGKTLFVSSKLLANLRNEGIMAFKKMSDDEQKRIWQWSKEVIRQYQIVLEADRSNIRNLEDLPFPKEDIKLAIKLSLPLYISKDMQSVVRMLKTAYKDIGAFQPIDPEDKGHLSSEAAGQGEVGSEQYQEALLCYERYMGVVVSEKKGLLQEINSYIIDLEALARDKSAAT